MPRDVLDALPTVAKPLPKEAGALPTVANAKLFYGRGPSGKFAASRSERIFCERVAK